MTAFVQLGFEVASRDKPWGPFIVRIVIIGAFWTMMLRAYVIASRGAMVRRRWWLYLLALVVLLTSMVVAVIYRVFTNPNSWS
ncbi:hypothetical protein [Aestuariimicrobium ganziense]|uniref:hypothetical protein n=1 Tax=Aestuariimicrobium ganziense TaxID=2773677 RepID=UPI001940D754|nr:hypothetical protein [Aestuariimicrobium ganziense]